MGLETLKQPTGAVDAGIFNLPPGFDTKRWAVEWVEEGMVPFKRQRQSLPGANLSADGWEVYKGESPQEEEGEETPKKRKPPGQPVTTRNGAGKKFILMVRPKQLQNDVNAVFGNVSKSFIRRETKGETVAGAPPDTIPGMLPASRLDQAGQEQTDSGEFGDVRPNVLSQPAEEPSAVQST